MSTAKIVELDDSNTCKLCSNALARYSCPKCGVKYCSLACYQANEHLGCSEAFYKSCIAQELQNENNETSKRKMLEILRQDQQLLENLDSDDESDDIGDIAKRLADVDLDNADQVWEKLTQDEQQEFLAFLKSEDVTKLIPPWTPWWSAPHIGKIEDVAALEEHKKTCPPLMKIKDFNTISKKQPADCVKFNLINVLTAYAFATRYFNGEHYNFLQEVISCIISIALTFKNCQNFDDFDSAVKSVELQCIQSDWMVVDDENFKLLKEDLGKIIEGPSFNDKFFYILAALSDLHKLFNSGLSPKKANSNNFSKIFPNDHFPTVKHESKTQIKSAIRKIEYLASYAKDFYG